MYVCIDQPGKVTNPARGRLNRENLYFLVLVHTRESGLARRVRPSCLASASLFSILRLNLVLTQDIVPDFRGGVQLLILSSSRMNQCSFMTSIDARTRRR